MREALISIMGELPGARWQDDEKLHITIRFVGEVDRHMAEDIAAALGSVGHRAFDLRLDGLGSFERRGRIDNIWAGIAPHEPLRSLHAAVTQALARVGVAPEERAYLPHITLARLSAICARQDVTGLERHWPPEVEGHFDHFLLYESELGREGPTYSAVGRYRLG